MQINVGDRVDRAVLDALPPSSRVNLEGSDFIRTLNGRWAAAGNPRTHYSSSDLGSSVVTFLPHPVEVPLPGETFESWEFRFVTTVTRSANSHGSSHLLPEAFREIGVRPNPRIDSLPPGSSGSEDMNAVLPAGSLVTGYDSRDGGPAVWMKEESYFRKVAPSRGGRLVGVAGWTLLRWGPDGPTEPPEETQMDEAERLRLAQTKARAWRVGMVLKRRFGWCETLEAILRAGGVTERDAEEPVAMTSEQVTSLPVGTVLFWQAIDNPNRWSLLVRDDDMSNRTRTRWLTGTTPVRHVRDRLRVAWRPGIEMGVMLPGVDMTAAREVLPVGWRFMVGGNTYRVDDPAEYGEQRFAALTEGGRVRQRYDADAFSGSEFVITFIPEVSREEVSV